MSKILINESTCIKCGSCVDICYARDVFQMTETGPVVVHPEICKVCGHCVAVCPTDSIVHDGLPLQDCPKIDTEQLPSVEQMVNAFRARRSYRRYSNKEVPRDIIEKLVSYSRWIPTGHNRQYIDWVVLDDKEKILDLLLSVFKELKNDIKTGRDKSKFFGNMSVEEVTGFIRQKDIREKRFFFNAPVILAGYCDKNTVCSKEEATYASYNITLTAERFGLGTCHIGSIQLLLEEFFHLQEEKLGIPEDKELQVLLTLGYPLYSFRRMVPRRKPDIKWNP